MIALICSCNLVVYTRRTRLVCVIRARVTSGHRSWLSLKSMSACSVHRKGSMLSLWVEENMSSCSTQL